MAAAAYEQQISAASEGHSFSVFIHIHSVNLRRIFQCNYIRAVLIEFEKIQAVFVVYREMSCKDDFFEFNFPAFMGDSFIFTFFILNEFFNKCVLVDV